MANKINVTVTGLRAASIPCEFRTVVLQSSKSIFDQMVQANTKYVVKWNFNLNGRTVNVPAGCIVLFDGGQLQNGKIHWNYTKVWNPYKYEILHSVEESGEKIIL